MTVALELLLQGSLALVTGVLYLYVARVIRNRPLSAEARAANGTFSVWWLSLGAVEIAAGALDMASAVGFRDVALFVTYVNVVLVLICLAVWGLTYYLAYLYTGSRRALWILSALYGGLALGLLYLIAWVQPTGFDETQATLTLAYTRKPPPAINMLVGVSLVVPVILAAIAYGSLLFRVEDRPHRFRIAVVSGSFLGWFGWSLVSTLLQLQVKHPGSVVLSTVNQLIALAVPLAVLLAYRPPSWLARRLATPAGAL